jgi:hypothetical protein
MNRNYLVSIGGILSLMFLLSACLTGPSIPTGFPTGTLVAYSGFYQFMLTDDGSWMFSEGGYVVAKGTYSIHDNEFTFETDSYCDGAGAGKASYIWTFKDDTLLFQVKGEDKCVGRYYSMHNIPYHKEQ